MGVLKITRWKGKQYENINALSRLGLTFLFVELNDGPNHVLQVSITKTGLQVY